MKARDLYCLAIRLAGVLFVVYAFFDLGHVALAALHLYVAQTPYPQNSLIAVSVFWMALGVLVTVLSKPVTHLVYGPDSN